MATAVVVLLAASPSLFCYCYHMLTDGFCHSCNICTQKSTSYPVVVLLPASLSLFCYCYYMLTDGFCQSWVPPYPEVLPFYLPVCPCSGYFTTCLPIDTSCPCVV